MQAQKSCLTQIQLKLRLENRKGCLVLTWVTVVYILVTETPFISSVTTTDERAIRVYTVPMVTGVSINTLVDINLAVWSWK